MSFGMRRVRRFIWDATRGPREKILARLRAHVARALAENFSQLTENVQALQRTGDNLAVEIRAAEARHQDAEREHRDAETRHLEAQRRAEESAQAAERRFHAAEDHYRQAIARYEQTLADYDQKLAQYHQTAGDSNLLAEGLIREMVRLQQHVDELAEAVDMASDAMRPETDAAPVTLKYRAAG